MESETFSMLATVLIFHPTNVLIALVGGILPALLWLGYWLREDAVHPEPRRIIFRTFVAGGLAALVSIPLEAAAYSLTTHHLALFVWVAIVEECTKYFAARRSALNTKFYDEPVDGLIYMITAALGFAALENVFFIGSSLASKGFITAAIIGESRFIGSTILHIVASSLIGIGLATTFYKGRKKKKHSFQLGLILAIALHTAFNFFILRPGTQTLFYTFLTVWILVIVLLAVFEKVKTIQP
jgi:RsiW-degrading membrane proteinase PrsW (M82 family)